MFSNPYEWFLTLNILSFILISSQSMYSCFSVCSEYYDTTKFFRDFILDTSKMYHKSNNLLVLFIWVFDIYYFYFLPSLLLLSYNRSLRCAIYFTIWKSGRNCNCFVHLVYVFRDIDRERHLRLICKFISICKEPLGFWMFMSKLVFIIFKINIQGSFDSSSSFFFSYVTHINTSVVLLECH